MRIIAALADLIDDELDGAEEYAELAHKHKLDQPRLAETIIGLAETEMTHVKTLHAEAARLIEESLKRDGDPPADMMAVYEYEHGKQIKRAAAIRQMIAEYRNS